METSPPNRKAVLLVIVVFVLGLALGALATWVVTARVYAERTRPPMTAGGGTARAMARMTQQLDLTPDQQKQVGAILGQMQSGYAGIRQQMDPQFEVVREKGHNEIRQILTADQQPKFEEFLRQVQEERKARAAAAAAAAAASSSH